MAIWLLYRAKDHPRVGDFDTEEAAQEWADDHGLVDWKPLLITQRAVDLFDGKEHKQICESCGTDWPCRVEKIEREARRLTVDHSYRCGKCGKHLSWIKIKVPGGGLIGEDIEYCGKLGACRTFALKELLRLGHHELHAKAEAARERRSADLAARKAAKQQRRDIWQAGVRAVTDQMDTHQSPEEGNA